MSVHRRIVALARWAVGALAILWIGWILVTEPLTDDALLGSAEARVTERRLAQAAAGLAAGAPGSLRVGWSRRDITPALGTPTLGHSRRRGKGTESVADELFARALALAAGDGQPCVLLGADLCIWPADLSDRIAAELAPRIDRDHLYFGASHTHNGPGGLMDGPLVELFAGSLDLEIVERIATGATAAVTEALDRLAPASYRELHLDASDRVHNRMRRSDRIDGDLALLEFDRAGARFGLVVFDAHATAIPEDLVVTSADYPGALVRALREEGFEDALFLAGATGQAGPTGAHAPAGTERAERFGRLLAHELAAASRASEAPRRHAVRLSTLRCEVALPRWRYAIAGRALDPDLAEWLLGRAPRAHVQALCLDDTILLGHSFEFSAVIDARLTARAREAGARLVVTSFNGDHNLYVVPDSYYDEDLYEARMSLFGSGLGPYLEWVSERVLEIVLADQS